jgi:hypothetical protein
MEPSQRNWRKIIRNTAIVLVILFVLVEGLSYLLIDKSNPKILSEPNWAASPETKTIVQGACFDCHSYETVWPWYSNIAPVSWLVWNDVHNGRKAMNFSDWNNYDMTASEIASMVNEGEMPPAIYKIMHPKARLSTQEKQTLIAGMYTVLGQAPGSGTSGGD